MPTDAELKLEEQELKNKKLKLEIGELEKPAYIKFNTWTSMFAVLIALGGVLGQNILSSIKSETAKRDMATMLAKRDSAKKEVMLLADSLVLLSKQKAIFEDSVTINLDKINQLVNATGVSENTKEQVNAIVNTTRNSIPSRVYIQIANDGQRALVQNLVTLLRGNSFVVPPVENVDGKATIPSQTDVRYYRDEDREEAMEIIKTIRSANLGLSVRDTPIKVSTKGTVRPRHYEIWLSKE